MSDLARFDSDPEALAWARLKVQKAVSKAMRASRASRRAGDERRSAQWRFVGVFIDRELLTGDDKGLVAFDTRLPDYVARMAARRALEATE